MERFLKDIKLGYKPQWNVVILLFIVLIYYIKQVIKKNLNHGGSYIDSLDRIKNKKVKLDHVNDNDKWYQYAAIAYNHEEIEKHSQRHDKS